ncbi:Kinesin motor domain protein/ Kinesin-3 [Giardia duodenalis assemblage B]|uniref:Kinesin motor domain protein/ Kinesin-3 n=1 Tax=Giardia duodenalis assemblage B TaxID=1394984 RepID=A0A132P0E9_GIAIN|nr:Kinesin motor domain protein/ Kinesin-3 [Giardia intestinalis assemblage B]
MPVTGVKVAVRVRPFNAREKKEAAKLCVDMPGGGKVVLRDAGAKKPETAFVYDYAYWSHDESRPRATQDTVYADVGPNVLDNAFEGYNYTLFAYGQTGSGKSYSMMGTPASEAEAGIIPRVGRELFRRAAASDAETQVSVSFLEIYNERLRDLLVPAADAKELKIRQDPTAGVFVQNLSHHAVADYDAIQRLIELGDKNRTVAATNMNATSSRSHSVFAIEVVQTAVLRNDAGEEVGRHVKRASVSLVDLAGSERQGKTGATGDRLTEGININKSLTTLGRVIEALAYNTTAEGRRKPQHVPYRDSQLTYLLQPALGGNSMTCMIAAISPASTNYDESLSTLRYADRAHQIENTVTKNESTQEKYIRELEDRVKELEGLLAAGAGGAEATEPELSDAERLELEAKIAEYDRLLKEGNQSLEEKLAKAEHDRQEMQDKLKKMGLTVAFGSELTTPYISSLSSNASDNGQLVYTLCSEDDLKNARPVTVVVGADNSGPTDCQYRISLVSKLGVLGEHFTISLTGKVVDSTASPIFPKITEAILKPLNAKGAVYVNGRQISADSSHQLHHGDRIKCGSAAQSSFYRYYDPPARAAAVKQSLEQDYDYVEPEITYDLALREYTHYQNSGKDTTQKPATDVPLSKENVSVNMDDAFSITDGMDNAQVDVTETLYADFGDDDERTVYEKKVHEVLRQLYPLICEANSIAEYFCYDIRFAAQARTSISPTSLRQAARRQGTRNLSKHQAMTKDLRVDQVDDDLSNILVEILVTAMAAPNKSKDRRLVRQTWALEKFGLRLFGMRRMYGLAMTLGKEEAVRRAHESADRDLEDDDEFPFDLEADIYNQTLTHLIGVGRIPLSGLLEACETDVFVVPIYDYSGKATTRVEVSLSLLGSGHSHHEAECLAFDTANLIQNESPVTTIAVYFKKAYNIPTQCCKKVHAVIHTPWFVNPSAGRPKGRRLSIYQENEFRRRLLGMGYASQTIPSSDLSSNPAMNSTIYMDLNTSHFKRDDVLEWLRASGSGLEVSLYGYTSAYAESLVPELRDNSMSDPSKKKVTIVSTNIVRTQTKEDGFKEINGEQVLIVKKFIFVDQTKTSTGH